MLVVTRTKQAKYMYVQNINRVIKFKSFQRGGGVYVEFEIIIGVTKCLIECYTHTVKVSKLT